MHMMHEKQLVISFTNVLTCHSTQEHAIGTIVTQIRALDVNLDMHSHHSLMHSRTLHSRSFARMALTSALMHSRWHSDLPVPMSIPSTNTTG